MRRSLLLCLGVLLAAVSTPRARADTFDFTFAGSIYAGSGQFTATQTTDYGPNITTYLVTGVTGSATLDAGTMNASITGVAPVGAGFQANDNLLFYPGLNGNDFFDGNGVAFTLSNGVIIDLYALGGIYETIPGRGALPDTGTVTVSPVPEPSSLALVTLPMLALLAFAARGYKRADRPATV